MKKILTIAVTLAIILSCTTLKAEDDKSVGKGNWMVGGTMDVNRIWGGGISGRTTFGFGAETGYFVLDYLMPEVKLNVLVTEGYNAEVFTAGVRGYWNKKTPLLPYARLNVGVGSIKSGNRYTAFALNPGIGVDYLIFKNVAIGLQANYTAYIRSSTSHEFDFPISFSVYF